MRPEQAVAYWDGLAETRAFTHPCDWDLLRLHLPASEPDFLDVGCGYGRLCVELRALGYVKVTGADFSPRMLARARREAPEVRFALMRDAMLPFPDAAFDVALLFAVLTCIPGDAEQDRLMRETFRVLKPGGLAYVSDYPLQRDERNLRRYAAERETHGVYGVFSLPDGGVARHHPLERLEALCAAFKPVARRNVELRTMNGHSALAWQYLGRKPRRDSPSQEVLHETG